MLLLQFVLSFLYSFHHRDYHTTLFQSEGKALPALLLSIGRQGIVFAICLLLLSNIFGYYGIISNQMIADIITAIIALILYKIYK